MRIGIYVEVAKDEQPTGIGRHVLKLLESLAQVDSDNEYLLYYTTPLIGAVRPFPHTPKQGNFRPRPVRFPGEWPQRHPRLWWCKHLPRVLARDRIDVFHGPNHFVPQFDRSRTVVTLHDLAYFKMSVHGDGVDATLREWTRRALDWSVAVIALSENTKRDIVELGVPDEAVHVIYGGGNIVPEQAIEYGRVPELRKTLGLPEKFILFIGALQPRKNVPFLVKAYAELRRRGQTEHDLVLAGPKSNAVEEIQSLVKELGIEPHVHLTGYLDDWQVPLLYKQADLFVLPTRYEGFTLVTLEAMAYGTPVVATDSSSIREGVGDAALLVPVDDVDRLCDAMARVIGDQNLRQSLVEKGRLQASKFTWEQCARETRALYESLARLPVASASA